MRIDKREDNAWRRGDGSSAEILPEHTPNVKRAGRPRRPPNGKADRQESKQPKQDANRAQPSHLETRGYRFVVIESGLACPNLLPDIRHGEKMYLSPLECRAIHILFRTESKWSNRRDGLHFYRIHRSLHQTFDIERGFALGNFLQRWVCFRPSRSE